MKLWLLRPIEGLENNPWEPWYDKAFGFVVRAETEERAREIANESGGDEKPKNAWLDSTLSTCNELLPDGEEGLIIEDFHAA
jgi:hypothetical protein